MNANPPTMRILILTIFAMFGFFAVQGQSYTTKKTAGKKALKYYEKGKELMRSNKNADALKEFERALQEDRKFIDAKIEWASIKFSQGDEATTEKALEEVIAMDPYYNSRLLYTLAAIEKRAGKCEEALKHVEMYRKAPRPNAALLTKAERLVSDCDFMLDAGSGKVPFDPKRMSEKINTKEFEYFPSLTADGEVFFYTRRLKGQEDIYFSRKTKDGWTTGQPIGSLNTPGNEANQSISADGKFMVYTACDRRDGYGSCDLYFSELKKGNWTTPVNMGPYVNTMNWESQPSVSADGKSVYFASRRKNNKGKADIYVSTRDKDGTWSQAKALSGKINTTGDDQTPFIHPDGKTLYFKSNGLPGFGGYDVFISRKKADGTWGEPKNLGAPINSKFDEGSFMVSLDGTTAYFDTNRKMDKNGAGEIGDTKHDIYYFELAPKLRPSPVTYVKARVIDAETKKPLQADVEFTDVKASKPHTSSLTDDKGEFLVCLPAGKNYGLNVGKKGYLFHSSNFALDAQDASLDEPFELTIELSPIPPAVVAAPDKPNPSASPKPETNKPIVLRNVFFDSGSAKLKSDSQTELNKLYDLLQEYPNMRIRIDGHTDNVGSDADNLRLSSDRAASVKSYLIGKGISSGRLESKGFGESKPIATNDTKEGKQLNRRTEFVVLSF